MYICPKCYFQTETPAKFCPHCGTGMNNVEPEAPAAPTYAPYNPAPTYSYVPKSVPEVSIGKKITGMALAAVGMIFAWVAFIYAILASEVSYRMEDAIASAALVLTIIALPLCIVGLVISGSSASDGRLRGFSIAGKICGIIGVVLSAIAFMVSVSYL